MARLTAGVDAGISSDLVTGDDGKARPAWAIRDPLLQGYYDTEWGMPVTDEAGLLERIILEGFQAGLSWLTILRKRAALRLAFQGFDADAVAAFGEPDVERLMADAAIIRNRRKIGAAITNARATVALRDEGGLAKLIWAHRPATTPHPRRLADVPTRSAESEALARDLRGHGFVFVGPTTMFAMMEAIGVIDTHLVGSHRRGTSGIWPD
ncbi:MAG TPA: DNA-3-methyladenine glycosylase I [Microbacteriaceae bacterium]|nr:DNA-3-methyladenine glycosylase I [Microbacteriaceae bacterium]